LANKVILTGHNFIFHLMKLIS